MTLTLRIPCPYCGAEQEIEVTASYVPEQKEAWGYWGGTEPIAAGLEDVTASELPQQCWACRAPHIDRDLAPALAARLDALTVEDFR